jgi:hypothetical protein
MTAFLDKLKTASSLLLEAEKEVQVDRLVDLPAAEASGILVAARHLIDRVVSYALPAEHQRQ